jgi:hypothetical protein
VLGVEIMVDLGLSGELMLCPLERVDKANMLPGDSVLACSF